MSKINTRATGPLHDQPERRFRVAVGRALDRATQRGLSQARALSPVDTGRLRRGWEAPQRGGWDQATLTNSVPYYRFVDRRIDLSGRAGAIVQRGLRRELDNEIPRALK